MNPDLDTWLRFLDAWERLLPPAVLGHVLEMLVMPRLRRACSEWEPRQVWIGVGA